MNETVKTAVDNLLVEPCVAFKARALEAVNAGSESDRRLAIGAVEEHLRTHPERGATILGETLVALRRAGC